VSDELLIVRCQLGEPDALEDLVREWHPTLHGFVRRMVGPAGADDVTQEVWIGILRGLPRLKDTARFAPWLFTIARRAVINRLRGEYSRPEVELDVDPAEAGVPTDQVVDRMALDSGLATLPAREREVLVLVYLYDLPLATCAEICGVPIGTIKSRLSRARRLLHDELTRKEDPT
jgi:RNA polymerase sigma-70 factor (ECF subfamily)